MTRVAGDDALRVELNKLKADFTREIATLRLPVNLQMSELNAEVTALRAERDALCAERETVQCHKSAAISALQVARNEMEALARLLRELSATIKRHTGDATGLHVALYGEDKRIDAALGELGK